jgi:hypothetical protein
VDGSQARESLGTAALRALHGQKEVTRGVGNATIPLSGREHVGFLYCVVFMCVVTVSQ